MEQRPIIIYDTDMDTDCDDVGALCMLCEYVLAGRVTLLGVMADAAAEEAAPCCEAICRHYGLNPPVGAVQVADYPAARWEKYANIRKTMADTRYYNRHLAAKLGKTAADYPRARDLYRSLLSEVEDGSVTVVCVGFPTALADLLENPTDRALFARKVVRVVSMANCAYPVLTKPNFNYDTEPIGSESFLKNCPVPIIISPDGTHVVTGAHLTDACEEGHPLRTAYEIYMEGERRGRSSWDLIALLYALEPAKELFSVTPHPGEQLTYDAATCRLSWEKGSRADAEIHILPPPEEFAKLLNRKMIGK